MVDIGNNIKVLLTRCSKNVNIDDIGGELLLYNHNHLCSFTDYTTVNLLKDFIFTGVGLEYLDRVVKMEIKDFYGKTLDFVVHLNYIFVLKQPNIDVADPMCVVSFLPKHLAISTTQFYAHFIEKIN